MLTNKLQVNAAKAWLKNKVKPTKKWIYLTALVSFISGLLLIGQFYLLSYICYAVFIENITRYDLDIYFMITLSVVLIRAGLHWLRERISFETAGIIKQKLRMDIIAHIDTLGPVKLTERSQGNFISAAMEQVEGIEGFLRYFLPQMIMASLMPIAILAVIFPYSTIAGLILLIAAPLIPLFMMLVGWGAESENQKHFTALARMSVGFLDTLQGLTTLRLFNREHSHANTIFYYSDNYRIKTMKVLKIAFLSSAVLELFSALSIALIAVYLGMGFINVGTDNNLWWQLKDLNLQHALFILLLAPEFFLTLRQLSTHYHAKSEAIGAVIELQKIFAIKPYNLTQGNKNLTGKINTVDFNQLEFHYPNNTRSTLKNINLSIHQKEKIAIVGPSGAGKTTLLNLLLKFIHSKNDQHIMVNESIPLNQITEKSWLAKISWLGQNAGLLKNTVRHNLLLANATAADSELWHALDTVHLKETIQQLPKQLDTEISEQGLGLSGGEIQRLALARAYLKPAEFMLFDEPTTSLDQQTEQLVIDALVNIWQDKTVVLLTHRLTFLEKMDRIIVMNHGKIVQLGDLKSLLSDNNGLFYALYKKQIH